MWWKSRSPSRGHMKDLPQDRFFWARLGTRDRVTALHMRYLCFLSFPSMLWNKAGVAMGEYPTLGWASTFRDERTPCTFAP